MLQYLFNYLWKNRNFVKVSSQWYVNLWNYYYTFEWKFKIFSLRLPFANYSHLYQLIGEGLGNPLQYSCLENPMDGGPGGLQSMGLLRAGDDWATSLSLFTFMHWRGKWQPTPVFLPGESQGHGRLVGCRLWGCTELDMTEVT